MTPNSKSSAPTDRGFALIISMSLMAFVLLAVLLLSSQLRVSLAGASSDTGRVLSRENARVSLAIAMASLQKIAGEDRRSTARAEILGSGNFTPGRGLWTGVWEGDNPTANPQWLVSGSQPDPSGQIAGESYEIVSATNSRPATVVEVEEINSGAELVGKFAWWASGEAAAAPVSGGRRGITVYEDQKFEEMRSRIEFATPFGVSLNSFFSGADIDEKDTEFASLVEGIRSVSEILFLSDSQGAVLVEPEDFDEVRDALSAASFGVLENPVDGGLKKNLADPDHRDDFLANDDLAEFLGPKKDGFLSVDSGMPDRRAYAGKPFFSPRPILSEAVLYIGLFHTWSDAKIRMRYHIEGEFWNPYSLPLRFAPDSAPDPGGYTRGVVLSFSGLPTIDVVAEELTVPDGWVIPDLNDDLNNLSSYSSNDDRRMMNSWMEISPTGASSGQPELEAGEVYRVMEPDAVRQPRGLARDFDTVRWSGNQQSRPDDEADIRITASHPKGGVTVQLDPYVSGNGEVAVFENTEFDDFEIVKKFRSGTNPFSRATSSSYTIQDYFLAYHFRINSDETDLLSMRDVQTAVDLREPLFRGVEDYEDVDGASRAKADLLQPNYTDPSFVVTDDSNLFSLLDQVTDGTVATLGQRFERSHEFGYRKMVLYDVPDGDAVSVGQLSSLQIFRRGPRSIGNEWGGELNEAFDAYYLSPKLIDGGGGGILGNPWLMSSAGVISEDADEDDAVDEMVHGAFNINSTSIDAWRSVLSSPVLTPQAEDENRRGRADVYRESTFFRLPGFQSEVGEFYMTQPEIQDPKRLFAQGVRVLDESQILAIATGIVVALQERAEPFLSLQEFVNSGIIAEAIQDVGSVPAAAADPINSGLMEHSNVFLDQSDIMTRIAPFATTRSDTFRIRAYGESVDPLTGESLSKVICEAVVQRMPFKVDGTDPMEPTLGLGDSRQFRLISLEWSDET